MTTQPKNSQSFRVFFSSPFKGMEEEREELTRKYIPEIQYKCAEMGLQFVAVDMRWGISSESAQQAQTINICLKEIDRSDMFICFFGQRYGWQGHTDSLLQENINIAMGKYPWLDNYRDRSVTELELRHGFLNNPGEMPSVVLFRDKKYDDVMKDLLKDKVANYTVENDHCREKLEDLRKKVVGLQAKALAVHTDYTNPHEGARLVYNSIIKYLNDYILKQSGELPRREKDLAPHKAFAAGRTSLYVRNQEHYDFLNNSLKASETGDCAGETGDTDSKETEESACRHVLVTGPAGCGKSSLLCNWIQDHVSQLPDVIVIPYYISCALGTRDPEALLDVVYGELDHHLGDASKTDAVTENHTDKDGNNKTDSSVNEQENNTVGESGAQPDNKQADYNSNTIKSDPTNSGNSGTSDSSDHGAKGVDTDTNNSNNAVPSADQQNSSSDNKPGAPASDQQPDKTNTDSDKKKDSQSEGDSSASKVVDETTNKADKMDEIAAGKTDGNTPDKKTDEKAADEDKAKTKGESRPKGRELQHQVMKKLEKLVEGGRTVVLVFDAVNRLVAANKTSKTLYWLPEKLSKGVVCVVSTEDSDQAAIDMLHKDRGFHLLKLGPLEDGTKQQICTQTLKQSGKELSQAQLDRIIGSQQTGNPLFLKIVLAELSIFGYFRKLDEKIDSLIHLASVSELLQNCLERLEVDYNVITFEGNLVGEIMKALYVAHQGLTESEVCNMFRIPSNVWSPLYFAMEYFIVSHLGNLGFAFGEIRDAVKERYFKDPDSESVARKKVISYFDGIRKTLRPWMKSKKLSEKPLEHAAVELVWLQRKEEDREGVILTLSDLAVFRILNDEYELDLLELWQWTGLRWSEVCNRLLTALDVGIADCYLATQDGELDTENSPGVRMRICTAHMRAFFDLANYVDGAEKVLKREIRILEHAEGKMKEGPRKEYLRDAYYYLACTYATQDRYIEARALHEKNMAEFEKALAEEEDEELRKQIAYTHNGLGILCMHSQEFDEGIDHLVKSAAYHNMKKDRRNEAAGYTNLGLTYMYMQDYTKALEYSNKALEAYEEVLFGQLTMDVGNVYTNIGLIYRRMKRLDKAEEAYLKSLQIKANAVGWDHMVVATAYMNLGTLEMHRKNYAKAEQWTRKAIGVYQANELAVTKKEYRRCRENLFANMLKQEKYEEVLPFFIELFDILHENGWLDECLAGMHRRMVEYIIENKPDMLDKAEQISKALIDSPKAHPQNYAHLLVIDMQSEDKGPERPYPYSLDACLEKFPTHSMYATMVELKMENFLLPKDDRDGIRKLLKHVVANFTETNYESIISQITTVAKELDKEDLWFQCLKSLLEEDPSDMRACQLFIRLCVHLERPTDALPFIDAYLKHFTQHSEAGGAEFNPDAVKPARNRLDVAKVLIARDDVAPARNLLLLVTAKSLNKKEREEAKTVLDSLPEVAEEDGKAEVTCAA